MSIPAMRAQARSGNSSYPQSAKRTLASSAKGQAPKAKSGKQQQARERTSGLSQ